MFKPKLHFILSWRLRTDPFHEQEAFFKSRAIADEMIERLKLDGAEDLVLRVFHLGKEIARFEHE